MTFIYVITQKVHFVSDSVERVKYLRVNIKHFSISHGGLESIHVLNLAMPSEELNVN